MILPLMTADDLVSPAPAGETAPVTGREPELQPSARIASLHLATTLLLLSAGGYLSLGAGAPLAESWPAWLLGQGLVALGLTLCFVILHDAAHGRFFVSPRLNRWVGHAAGFASGIPYWSWRLIHQSHHRWAGWKDRDPTTEQLVPRDVGLAQRWLFNACWWTGLPLFSVVYRLFHFWNLPRLWRWLGSDRRQREGSRGGDRRRARVLRSVIALLLGYGLLVALVGPATLARCLGLGVFLHLAFMDPLLLSQHAHLPQRLAGDVVVSPVPLDEHASFTRSLLFPPWVSRWLLLAFDRHATHHRYPWVPGYRLHRVPGVEAGVPWWRWYLGSKRVSAHTLLFGAPATPVAPVDEGVAPELFAASA